MAIAISTSYLSRGFSGPRRNVGRQAFGAIGSEPRLTPPPKVFTTAGWAIQIGQYVREPIEAHEVDLNPREYVAIGIRALDHDGAHRSSLCGAEADGRAPRYGAPSGSPLNLRRAAPERRPGKSQKNGHVHCVTSTPAHICVTRRAVVSTSGVPMFHNPEEGSCIAIDGSCTLESAS
jgi:hypothetical protein